ncbi:MAG: type II secretion system F family protein [Gemmata sp.]
MPLSLLFAMTLTGCAAAVAAYFLTSLSGSVDDLPGAEGVRLRTLRESSPTFRVFEPTVRALARFYARRSSARLAKVTHQLEVLGTPHWKAEELAAAKQVEAALIGAGAAFAAGALFGLKAGLVLGGFIAIVFPYLLLNSIKAKAEEHIRLVRSRLPYAMDLMALMLEAGAGTLQECIGRAGQEHAGQPLGEEFRRVLTGVEKGVKATDMLKALDRRLADADVKDLVLTVNTAEERGIALKDALRGLSDRMRQRRVQRMEKSAEEAKVKITGPAMVTMFGCLLIVVAPIVLTALNKTSG